MRGLNYRGNNTDYFYLEKREKELKFLEKLCLKCGIGFKLSNSLGICKNCLKEGKSK